MKAHILKEFFRVEKKREKVKGSRKLGKQNSKVFKIRVCKKKKQTINQWCSGSNPITLTHSRDKTSQLATHDRGKTMQEATHGRGKPVKGSPRRCGKLTQETAVQQPSSVATNKGKCNNEGSILYFIVIFKVYLSLS